MDQRFKLLTLLSLFVSISSFGMEQHEPKQLEIKKATFCIKKEVFSGEQEGIKFLINKAGVVHWVDADLLNPLEKKEAVFLVDPQSANPLILEHQKQYKIESNLYSCHVDCMGGTSLLREGGGLTLVLKEMARTNKDEFKDVLIEPDNVLENSVWVIGGWKGHKWVMFSQIERFLAGNDEEEESSKS